METNNLTAFLQHLVWLSADDVRIPMKELPDKEISVFTVTSPKINTRSVAVSFESKKDPIPGGTPETEIPEVSPTEINSVSMEGVLVFGSHAFSAQPLETNSGPMREVSVGVTDINPGASEGVPVLETQAFSEESKEASSFGSSALEVADQIDFVGK